MGTLMRFYIFSLVIFPGLASCGIENSGNDNSGTHSESSDLRDLNEILESGKIRAITVYSSTNYFLYRGQPMGYEYELLQRLAEYLGLELEILVANEIREMFDMLNRGDGDVLAAGLTITNERRHDVRFTEYLYLTKQMLVQRKPENWRKMKRHVINNHLVKDPIELIGDTVHVTKNSSFFRRLKNLEEEIGGNIHIQVVDGDISTEKLISMVVNGEIKYTVADEQIAYINATFNPVLDVKTALSFSQRIAWALRKENTDLADTLNFWITKMKKYNDYYAIYDKYFRSSRSFKKRIQSDFYSEKTGKISPYDEVIRTHVAEIGWDWRLIASLIYQESHFDPGAKSWASANGLMQLMPATAKELGVKNMADPNDNLRGGIKYLHRIWDKWDDIADSTERLKFTFASYNCGIHHLFDAQKLAKREGLDPLVWDDNVEKMILNLTYPKYYRDPEVKYGYVRGREPVEYVKNIFKLYENYKDFVPESPRNES